MKALLTEIMHEFGLKELPKDTLSIRSSIPIASGLGSGAALSAAVIREIEKIYHGTPSGIDNTVIAYEQPIRFIKGKGFEPLQADIKRLPLLIVDSGIRSRTVDVVSDVRANFERNEAAIHEIGNLVRTAETVLQAGDPEEIGSLMNENQRLLKAMDVSCPQLDELITLAAENGAYGAKLTGAGRGGNFIIMARDRIHAADLGKLYEKRGLHCIL